jgi:hypothetical protein
MGIFGRYGRQYGQSEQTRAHARRDTLQSASEKLDPEATLRTNTLVFLWWFLADYLNPMDEQRCQAIRRAHDEIEAEIRAREKAGDKDARDAIPAEYEEKA